MRTFAAPLPRIHSVDQDTPLPTTERPSPLGFLLLPAFVGGLVWLVAMLNRLHP
jgi:hypothetical protein